jgi:hypothetical protein
LTLKEEHRLRMFENRDLRRIFEPKRNGVVGRWRKVHNEELHNFYSPSMIRIIKSRRMRWMGRRGMYSFGGKVRRKGTTRKTKS